MSSRSRVSVDVNDLWNLEMIESLNNNSNRINPTKVYYLNKTYTATIQQSI